MLHRSTHLKTGHAPKIVVGLFQNNNFVAELFHPVSTPQSLLQRSIGILGVKKRAPDLAALVLPLQRLTLKQPASGKKRGA
jgi:hypothetical protein